MSVLCRAENPSSAVIAREIPQSHSHSLRVSQLHALALDPFYVHKLEAFWSGLVACCGNWGDDINL